MSVCVCMRSEEMPGPGGRRADVGIEGCRGCGIGCGTCK